MKNKEELFATFELSKLAKEKGFNKYCISFYKTKYSFINEPLDCLTDTKYPECVKAPLYDQLTNWLRDEKDIDITIMPVFREKCGYDYFKRDGYTFEIMRIQPCQYLTWSDFNQCAEDRDAENKECGINERCLKPSFKTHREALNEAIKQGLNLIK